MILSLKIVLMMLIILSQGTWCISLIIHSIINWYNYRKIEYLAKKIGFSEVIKSGYLQSISPFMRAEAHFDSTWPQMSLYVDLIK